MTSTETSQSYTSMEVLRVHEVMVEGQAQRVYEKLLANRRPMSRRALAEDLNLTYRQVNESLKKLEREAKVKCQIIDHHDFSIPIYAPYYSPERWKFTGIQREDAALNEYTIMLNRLCRDHQSKP
jgi:hypothetical protein